MNNYIVIKGVKVPKKTFRFWLIITIFAVLFVLSMVIFDWLSLFYQNFIIRLLLNAELFLSSIFGVVVFSFCLIQVLKTEKKGIAGIIAILLFILLFCFGVWHEGKIVFTDILKL